MNAKRRVCACGGGIRVPDPTPCFSANVSAAREVHGRGREVVAACAKEVEVATVPCCRQSSRGDSRAECRRDSRSAAVDRVDWIDAANADHRVVSDIAARAREGRIGVSTASAEADEHRQTSRTLRSAGVARRLLLDLRPSSWGCDCCVAAIRNRQKVAITLSWRLRTDGWEGDCKVARRRSGKGDGRDLFDAVRSCIWGRDIGLRTVVREVSEVLTVVVCAGYADVGIVVSNRWRLCPRPVVPIRGDVFKNEVVEVLLDQPFGGCIVNDRFFIYRAVVAGVLFRISELLHHAGAVINAVDIAVDGSACCLST